MAFQKAVKHEAKLRLAIAGPAGSGKTYTALAIATALANGGKIALVDTEHGSASKYADLFDFDVLEMTPPFHPKRFVEAISDAGREGYSVIILDSLTHAWSGQGGLLEIVDSIAARMKTSNTFAAWKDATPIQNALVEGIVAAPLHVIATMRSKQEYVLSQDDRGKSTPRKVGMAPQQRDGFEYEFDVFIDMDIDNTGIVQKTRCPELTGKVFKRPGADVAGILLTWLSGEKRPPAQSSNGTGQQQQAPPGFSVWADWRNANDAKAWAMTQGKFNAQAHMERGYEKVKADKQPASASAMWAAWYEYVTAHEPAKAAGHTITDAELDGEPVDETPQFS